MLICKCACFCGLFNFLIALDSFSAPGKHGKRFNNRSEDEIYFPRIIACGFKARLGRFPYQVSIQLRYAPRRNVCGGSIINTKYVLTAQHCVHGHPWHRIFVAVGLVNLNSRNAEYHNAIDIIGYPNFDSAPLNDIALVKITDEFNFNDFIKPIKIASNQPEYMMDYIASGWGATNQERRIHPEDLLAIYMPMMDPVRCSAMYFDKLNTSQNLCAGGTYDQGPCFGDSGDPLVLKDVLYGITLGGKEISGVGYSCVYANVSYFHDWIKEKSRNNVRSVRGEKKIYYISSIIVLLNIIFIGFPILFCF